MSNSDTPLPSESQREPISQLGSLTPSAPGQVVAEDGATREVVSADEQTGGARLAGAMSTVQRLGAFAQMAVHDSGKQGIGQVEVARHPDDAVITAPDADAAPHPHFSAMTPSARDPGSFGADAEQIISAMSESLRQDRYAVLACDDHDVAREVALIALTHSNTPRPFLQIDPETSTDRRTEGIEFSDLVGTLSLSDGSAHDGPAGIFLGPDDEWRDSPLAVAIEATLRPDIAALAVQKGRRWVLSVTTDWIAAAQWETCPHRREFNLDPLVPCLAIELRNVVEATSAAEKLKPVIGPEGARFRGEIRGKGREQTRSVVTRWVDRKAEGTPEWIQQKVSPDADVCLATAVVIGAFLCPPEEHEDRPSLSIREFAEAGRCILAGRPPHGTHTPERPGRLPLTIWDEETDRLLVDARLAVRESDYSTVYQTAALSVGSPHETIRRYRAAFLQDCMARLAVGLLHWTKIWPAIPVRAVARAVAAQSLQGIWPELEAVLVDLFQNNDSPHRLSSNSRVVAGAFAEAVARAKTATGGGQVGVYRLQQMLDRVVTAIANNDAWTAVALRSILDRTRPDRERLNRLMSIRVVPHGREAVLLAVKARLQTDPLATMLAIFSRWPQYPEREPWRDDACLGATALFEYGPSIAQFGDQTSFPKRRKLQDSLLSATPETLATISNCLSTFDVGHWRVVERLSSRRIAALVLMHAMFDVLSRPNFLAEELLDLAELSLDFSEGDLDDLPPLGLVVLVAFDWITAGPEATGVLSTALRQTSARRQHEVLRGLRRLYDLLGGLIDILVRVRDRALNDPVKMLRKRRRHLKALSAIFNT